MRAVVVAVLLARSALAQPPGDPDAAFEACKARRHALTREAMAIADVNERGRALARIPICLRLEDRSTEIIGLVPTPWPPRPVPLVAELELVAGPAFYGMSSPHGSFLARGAAVGLTASTPVGEHVALAAFASYGIARGSFLYVDDFATHVAPFDAREQLAVGGAMVRYDAGRAVLGLGLGLVEQHEPGYSTFTGPVDATNQLAALEADLGFAIVRAGAFDLRVLAVADLAGGLGVDETIRSVRLALGVSWRSREVTVLPR